MFLLLLSVVFLLLFESAVFLLLSVVFLSLLLFSAVFLLLLSAVFLLLLESAVFLLLLLESAVFLLPFEKWMPLMLWNFVLQVGPVNNVGGLYNGDKYSSSVAHL